MKLLDILKAIRQEEICDEMITTYDEENKFKVIESTFSSVRRRFNACFEFSIQHRQRLHGKSGRNLR